MKMLFTGASGFIGHNILPLLQRAYGSVTTLGLGASDDITVNLADEVPVLPERYDVVLHTAGMAHVVPRTPDVEERFYAVNHGGTRNLCAALEAIGVPKALVYVSTVAVYGCESGVDIDESHPLEGTTPYARSKIMAEQFLTDWCHRHGVTLTILRPSILAGVNPPGNLGDMIRGIRRGMYLNIAGGRAAKSMLMAQDLVRLLPLVVDRGGIYNVCDTYHPTYAEVSKVIARQLGRPAPPSIPLWVARTLARIGDIVGPRFPINSARLDKMVKPLTFSCRKAVETLGWQPLSVLENFRVR